MEEMIGVNGGWMPLAKFEQEMRPIWGNEIVDELIEKARSIGGVQSTVEGMRARDEWAKIEVAKMWAEVFKGR